MAIELRSTTVRIPGCQKMGDYCSHCLDDGSDSEVKVAMNEMNTVGDGVSHVVSRGWC